MGMHQVAENLQRADFPASGTAMNIRSASKSLIRWGTDSDPTSLTPDSVFYIKTDGTTTTTVIFVNINGTYTALTVE